ncbi:MAG: NAD(P)/FAD-dependent oxidoreductase [Desulfobacterales bacterium]|nr:NAD(P)/FAD-dependent oxidoreductase [Desulfobacterales bacterium]
MHDTYDVIVIGTGCGGAAAAALSSYYGYKTLVLEKCKFVGGRAATIERKGFKMDHGHLVATSKKGPHGEVLRIVKCKDLIPEFATINNMPMYMVILDQTYDFTKNLLFKLLSLEKGLRKSNYVSLPDIPNILRLLFRIRVMRDQKTRELDNVDLKTFISTYTDSEFIHSSFGAVSAACFGVLPYETSAGETIRTLQSMQKTRCIGYPVTGEGIAAIPKSFLKAAQRYGADVRLKTPVEQIVVENEVTKGVNVNGHFIRSDMVISNAGIKETSFKLVGKNHFTKEYLDYLENLRYSYGGISLKYALDKSILNFNFGGKVPVNYEQNMRNAMDGTVPREVGVMLVCTSNIDHSLAPNGKQILLAISPGPPVAPGKVDWDPWVANLRRQIEEEIVPEISQHILFCDVSTPDKIARQNSRFMGDAIGVAQSFDQVGRNTPPSISPIKNLYHVGADVGSKGIATEMATQSAIDLFEQIQ